MSNVVHTVWVGPSLSMMEQLTIKLYQKHGYDVWLWTYDECRHVPSGTILKDASEVMPRSSLFTFQGTAVDLPNCGRGSYSHWSDQFQLHVLYKHGGIYSQLDVSCLQSLDFLPEYAFAPLGEGPPRIQTCLMKLPAKSSFARECLIELERLFNKDTCTKFGWLDSMECITKHVLRKGLGECIIHRDLMVDFAGPSFMLGHSNMLDRVKFVHWSNAWSHQFKKYPKKGTFYQQLLDSVGLTESLGQLKLYL